jgi:aspartyl-tRNA(Asn)/glutamyl-tRNA(Gln) amidotransferase subunit A
MDGVLPLSPSMDTAGVIAASSAEAALTLDVIAGTSGARSAARLLATPVTGLRIGYARDWFANDTAVYPAVVAAMDAAASVLSERGALVQRVTLPPYGPIEVAAAAVLLRESYDLHRAALAQDAAGYGRKTYQSLVGGGAISDAQLAAAHAAGVQFGKALDTAILSDFDAVITVCALTPALPLALFGKGSVWTPMRTIPFNLSGHPVLALPIGFADGLPLGMQIIGKHHDEATICQIGAAFELGTDFALQRPPQPPR